MKRPQRSSAVMAQKRLKTLAATGRVRHGKPIISESESMHSEDTTSCSESIQSLPSDSESASLLPAIPDVHPPAELSAGSLSSDESSSDSEDSIDKFVVHGELDEDSVSWGERDEARIAAKRDLRILRLSEQADADQSEGKEDLSHTWSVYKRDVQSFLRGANYPKLYQRFRNELIKPMEQFGSEGNVMSPVNMLMAVHGAWILNPLPNKEVKMQRCTLCNITKPTTYEIVTQNGRLHVGYAGSSCYRRFVFIERAQDLLRVLVDAVQPGVEPDDEQVADYCKQLDSLIEAKYDCANFLEASLVRKPK